MGGEGAGERGKRDAGLRDDDLVRGRVLEDPIEAPGPEEDIEALGAAAELELRPASDEHEAPAVARRFADDPGRLLDGGRLADDPRQDAQDGVGVGRRPPRGRAHSRQASPVVSVACAR